MTQPSADQYVTHGVSQGITLGIDFGTSNSAVSWTHHGQNAQLISLEDGHTSLPTAVFFDADENRTYFGRQAIAQYLAGQSGRLMRSLKREVVPQI